MPGSKVSFTIYEPDGKRFHLTRNWIMLIVWGTLLASTSIFKSDEFRVYGALAAFLLTVYYLISAPFTYQPLNGALKGKITFDEDCIRINDDVFKLTYIDELDFFFYDHYGQRDFNMFRSVNPILRQGVKNYVTFVNEDGDIELVYFKFDNEDSHLLLKPFINVAINYRKMSFKRRKELVEKERSFFY